MSAHSFSQACLSTLLAIWVGGSTVVAQSPQLPLKVIVTRTSVPETSEKFGPAETPTDLRLFFRCFLHGVHPATGLLRVDDLIEFDDAEIVGGLLPGSAVYGIRVAATGASPSPPECEVICQEAPASSTKMAYPQMMHSHASEGGDSGGFDPKRYLGSSMSGWPDARTLDQVIAPASAVEINCPFLQQAGMKIKAAPPTFLQNDFQENLGRLEAGRKLYEMGQFHFQAGDRDGAFYFFAQIHSLCPGSRYDVEAEKQIQEMARLVTESDDAAGAYEQEMHVTPPAHSLLDCRQLQLQIIPLAPTLVPFSLLPDLIPGAGATPAMPSHDPIDPTIIETLLKALKEAGEFGVPRLILHVEAQSASEEQEKPESSEWRSQPNEVEFPSLFVDPVDDPLTITEEQEGADKVEDAPLDLTSLIQEVIDVIHSGQSVLVEKAGVGLELELEVDLRGANVKVMTGYSGHRFVLVALSPEASGDLRAAQRAHNERILNWIASLNEGLFDCDAAEEEDADYGNEPVNEAIP